MLQKTFSSVMPVLFKTEASEGQDYIIPIIAAIIVIPFIIFLIILIARKRAIRKLPKRSKTPPASAVTLSE